MPIFNNSENISARNCNFYDIKGSLYMQVGYHDSQSYAPPPPVRYTNQVVNEINSVEYDDRRQVEYNDELEDYGSGDFSYEEEEEEEEPEEEPKRAIGPPDPKYLQASVPRKLLHQITPPEAEGNSQIPLTSFPVPKYRSPTQPAEEDECLDFPFDSAKFKADMDTMKKEMGSMKDQMGSMKQLRKAPLRNETSSMKDQMGYPQQQHEAAFSRSYPSTHERAAEGSNTQRANREQASHTSGGCEGFPRARSHNRIPFSYPTGPPMARHPLPTCVNYDAGSYPIAHFTRPGGPNNRPPSPGLKTRAREEPKYYSESRSIIQRDRSSDTMGGSRKYERWIPTTEGKNVNAIR